MSDKDLMERARELAKECNNPQGVMSVAWLQRRLQISYNRASVIHDALYAPKPTNGDRIRAMSNEELAKLWSSGGMEVPGGGYWGSAYAEQNWLEYLNAPAESEGK